MENDEYKDKSLDNPSKRADGCIGSCVTRIRIFWPDFKPTQYNGSCTASQVTIIAMIIIIIITDGSCTASQTPDGECNSLVCPQVYQ